MHSQLGYHYRLPLNHVLIATMDVSSFEIFAELSVAILGFSGVIAVLGNSKDEQLFVAARVRGLLVTAGIAAIASIAPLTGLDFSYCSVMLIVLMFGSQCWSVWLMKQKAARPSWVIFYVSFVFIVGGLVTLVYALAIEPSFLIHGYMYSVCIMLLLAGLFFVRMVLAITSERKGN